VRLGWETAYNLLQNRAHGFKRAPRGGRSLLQFHDASAFNPSWGRSPATPK